MDETVRYVPGEEARSLVTIPACISAARRGYREHGEGAVTEPTTKLYDGTPDPFFMFYGVIFPKTAGLYLHAHGFGGAEWVALSYVMDAETGDPLAIVDSALLNPYKTAAAGGVAVDALAREDAERVGIVGSGTQARAQLLATAAVRDIADVAVYSPTDANRRRFASEMDRFVDADVRAVPSSADAVSDRDIVITATRSSTPVFDGNLLAPGTHVTAMGQATPTKRELDASAVARAVYVADIRERVENLSGSYLAALDEGAIADGHLHAELGEILTGERSGRTGDEEITIFDSG